MISLLIRGSAGESFRAPDMHYVYAGSSSYFDSVTDYRDCYAKGVPTYQACDNSVTLSKVDLKVINFLMKSLVKTTRWVLFGIMLRAAHSPWIYSRLFSRELLPMLMLPNIAVREAYCVHGDDFSDWYNNSDFSSVNCTDTLNAVVRGTPDELDQDGLGDIDEITTFNQNQSKEEFQGIDTTLRYSWSTESLGDFSWVLYNSNIISRYRKADPLVRRGRFA